MILWYFFHKYFIRKKNTVYTLFVTAWQRRRWRRQVNSGWRSRWQMGRKPFCLRLDSGHIYGTRHNMFWEGSKACPGGSTARWAVEGCWIVRVGSNATKLQHSTFESRKKRKSRPTNPPSEKWLVDNQRIFFFLALCTVYGTMVLRDFWSTGCYMCTSICSVWRHGVRNAEKNRISMSQFDQQTHIVQFFEGR